MNPSDPPAAPVGANLAARIEDARRRSLKTFVLFAAGAIALVATSVIYFVLAGGVDVRVGPDAVRERALVAIERGIGVMPGPRSVIAVGDIDVAVSADGYRTQVVTIGGDDRASGVDVTLERLLDVLKVTVSPTVADAQFFVDETLVSTGPGAEIELSEGRHRITVRHPLYRSAERDVEAVGGGNRIDLSVTLERAAQRVDIASTPAGATIRVDGAEKGVTPVTVDIDEGQHEIEASLAGYVTETRFLNVARDKAAVLALIVLNRNPGFIRVKTEPAGASILIDGEYRGTTPLSVPVAPVGKHTVAASQGGRQSATAEVTVASGETREVVLRLAENSGKILIESTPSATVMVNGTAAGATPVELTLPAVAHEIRIEKEGFQAISQTVTPDPGSRKRIQVTLTSKIEAMVAKAAKAITTAGGQQMILVEPGKLMMGADRSEPGQRANEIKRSVIISRHFYFGLHEVTAAEFAAFRKADGAGAAIKETREPVANVTWADAAAYANWLSGRDRLRPVYSLSGSKLAAVDVDANGYRLPTEAEWEWVARYQGGKGRMPLKFPWGPAMPVAANAGNFADESALAGVKTHITLYNDGAPGLAAVGRYPANSLGVFDLGGNVAEWIHDYYELADFNTPADEIDRLGPTSGPEHVIRGSSWRSATLTELRMTYREAGDAPRDDVGFRLARWLGSRHGD